MIVIVDKIDVEEKWVLGGKKNGSGGYNIFGASIMKETVCYYLIF